MIHSVTLAVSFPVFGNNYYSQPFVSRKTFDTGVRQKLRGVADAGRRQSLQQ